MVKKTQINKTAWSVPKLEKHIREVAKDSSRVVFTPHAEKRLRQRKITKLLVIESLRKGSIKRQPEPNTMKGSLECKMDYYVAGHDIATLVALYDEHDDLIIVTAM